MIKNVLSNIGGVELYGVVSITLFFTVFTGAIVWALRLKKSFLESAGNIPLDEAHPASALSKGDSRHE